VVAYVFGVVLFALGIGVSVALHEFGHLLTAKAFGMKVTRYFIGFGPRLWSFRRGETEYGLKAVPAGGFCEIVGMTALEQLPETDSPRAFYRKPVWQRVIVLGAGSVTHFIVGFVILYFMAVSMGLPNLQDKPVVGEVSQCAPATQDPRTFQYSACGPNDPAPARNAGIMSGDVIVSVAGKPTPTYTDVVNVTRQASGPTPFVVERNGQRLTLVVDVAKVRRVTDLNARPGQDNKLSTVSAVGLANTTMFHYGAFGAVGGATRFTGDMFAGAWTGLKQLPAKIPPLISAIGGGQRDINSPVSVVGATRIGGEAVEQGLWPLFVLLLANLNFFIGVFNLLPLLPLDGGHVAVNVYEKLRDSLRRLWGKPAGGPVDYTKLLPLTYAVILVGGAVVLLTVTADIVNPIRVFGQ
jgi:membrane-associated protease RseP (regulator of RpoE activity)